MKYHNICNDAGGYRSFGNIYEYGQEELIHFGDDLNNNAGDGVNTPADGEVVRVDTIDKLGGVYPSRPGGLIVIKYTNIFGEEMFGYFAHIAPIVSRGDKVTKGQMIGTIQEYYVGNKRRDHLHIGLCLGPRRTERFGYGERIENWKDPKYFIPLLVSEEV